MNLLRRGLLAGAAITAVTAAVAIPLATATASVATGVFTAAQSVTSRDDSGANGGNWATDNFTRTTHLYGVGVVVNSFCPGIAYGSCHHIKGTISDRGTFTTNVGNLVPGTGSLNGGPVPAIGTAVTGPMHGSITVNFYANVPVTKASAGNAPASVSGDSPSTGQWVEQFFPQTVNGNAVQFWDTNGNTNGSEYLDGNGSWTYTEAPGANPACPNESSQWVDGSAGNWGSLTADGNILAQDAAHC